MLLKINSVGSIQILITEKVISSVVEHFIKCEINYIQSQLNGAFCFRFGAFYKKIDKLPH
ncbi:hypothetical protein A6E02_04870 [Aliivibrio fischeri]|nr:hypothetical protein A6E02_04870 [Aliivibrio fischeri]OED57163.1 hypothetical protein BEI47_12795 [Aliivibrio fischeri]